MDVAAVLHELQSSLGVDELALLCISDAKLEGTWLTRDERGLRVSDRGETYLAFLADDYFPTPPEEAIRAVCARFDVDVIVRDEDVFELERIVGAEHDVREALRAVLSAQDALGAAAEASREAGGRWDDDVLAVGRDHELPFDDEV
jgi:hypothetical protein